MYSLLYLVIFIVLFVIVYICVNYTAKIIFNKGRRQFRLKPKTKYRLANNYIYGDRLDDKQNGTLNCTTEAGELIECDIDPDNELGVGATCAQCKQLSARCVNIAAPVYSAADSDVIVIQPNKSPNKGYCLPSATTVNSCTRRNGGKWILTMSRRNNDEDVDDKFLVYTFECFCSTPKFFQNNTEDGDDCTRFVGCRNGTLANATDWSSYEAMRCTCPEDLYEEQIGTASVPPACTPLNIYRRHYSTERPAPFDVLDEQYIDRDYRVMISGHHVTLPNPCTFDLTTKQFLPDIGRVVWNKSKTIAYCQSIHSDYRSALLNDDYLQGNGGQFANAVFRYRMHNVSEANDDASDHNNDYENAVVYEVLRKNSAIENLAGIRLPYSNFPIYLPYLEASSYNMGQSNGRHYKLHPVVPADRHRYTMVYVFDVAVPDYRVKVKFGSGISYIPSFMCTSMESANRVYNGAIPCVNVAIMEEAFNHRAFWIMYPVPPGSQYTTKLGKTGIMGELYKPAVESEKFTSGYGFHFSYKGNVEPYSELFTGTLFTYTVDKKIYTRPVSCGDMVLTSKYRLNYDPRWRNHPSGKLIGYATTGPFQFAQAWRDAHMFTRNSYDIERHEVGVTTRKISRYELSETAGPISFKTFYS